MVFQRSQWNALISQVNNVRASPPADTDCEPLPPIAEVPAGTIWGRSHISAVQNALAETCSGISFQEPQSGVWNQAILNEISGQLGAAWCDCEDDGNCEDGQPANSESGMIIELFTQTLEVFCNCFGRRIGPDIIDPQTLVDGIQLRPGRTNRSFAIMAVTVNPDFLGRYYSSSPAGGLVSCGGRLTVTRNTSQIGDATGPVLFCGTCDVDCQEHIAEEEAALDPSTNEHMVKYHVVIFAESAECQNCAV